MGEGDICPVIHSEDVLCIRAAQWPAFLVFAEARRERLPRSPGARGRFLRARAGRFLTALSELQDALRALAAPEAEGLARRTLRELKPSASRKHFRPRRRPATDEGASHWLWALGHAGSALHLLRDHPPWFLTVGLLAAQYGLPTDLVRMVIHLAAVPQRGPRPGSWRPPPACAVCGPTRPAPDQLVGLCSHHTRTLPPFPP